MNTDDDSVELVAVGEDEYRAHCHRCRLELWPGDLAQDRGDHWYCKHCAR